MDVVGAIIEYEDGTLDEQGTIQLFAELVRSGMASQLQGHYGRVATAMIEAGIITRNGGIPDAGLHPYPGPTPAEPSCGT